MDIWEEMDLSQNETFWNRKEQEALEEKEQKDAWIQAKKAAADYAMRENRRDQEENNVPDTYWWWYWFYLENNFTIQPK